MATITWDTSYYNGNTQRIGHGHHMICGSIALDSSYAFGGEDVASYLIDTSGGKFKRLDQVIIEPRGGFSFEYDYTNNKVKVFSPAPPIVYDEVHTIATAQITLDYPAAAILNMASATATQLLAEPTATLGANEVQLAAAMSAGARPTFTFHASTTGAIKTTYITQAWRDVWLNRKASQALTRATHVARFTETACFIESALPTATGTAITNRPLYIEAGDAAATLEAEVDWSDSGNSSLPTLTFYATDAMTACKCTYIALPASGFLFDRWLEDEAVTLSSGVSAANKPARPILFKGLCGQLPDSHAAGARTAHYLEMPWGDALGTGQEFMVDYQAHPGTGITGHIKANDTTSDTVTLAYVYGKTSEIPNLVQLECKNATTLAALTAVPICVIGSKV